MASLLSLFSFLFPGRRFVLRPLPGAHIRANVPRLARRSPKPLVVGSIPNRLCQKSSERGGDVSGEQNLIPFDQRTEAEQKAIRTAGGIASGAARRRKRSLREAADLYLSLPVSDRRRWNKIARKGVDPEDVDNQMAMIIGLTEAATQGDARAAKIIVDLLGDVAGEDQGGVQIIDDL